MRDITIPTSRLSGKGTNTKSHVVSGLRRVATAIDNNKPQQAVKDFVSGLRNDLPDEES
jgi:hypothetical protein